MISQPNEHGGAESSAAPQTLERRQWSELAEQHHAAVDALTRGHLTRAAEHRTHPVEDFLFTYYSVRPSQLRRWHPGAGIALLDADERCGWRFHRALVVDSPARTAVVADAVDFLQARGSTVTFIARLLTGTQSATPGFGCFGLHEWAMVYRAADRRHPTHPLRLGQAGTDDVVEQHQIRCSHYDAYRFFTPEAKPRNLLVPDRDTRENMEQPGCLHASMDLYKWAYRLLPIVCSSTVLD